MTTDSRRTGGYLTLTRQEDILVELELTRIEFHALLERIPAEAWELAVTDRWTVRVVMKHIETYLSFVLPRVIANGRRGRDMKTPKGWIADAINAAVARVLARGRTPESVAREYEASHDATMKALIGMTEEDLDLVTSFPAGRMSLENAFRVHREHFLHHADQVERALAPRAGLPLPAGTI